MAIVPGVGAGNVPESVPQPKFAQGRLGYNREPDLSIRRIASIDSVTRVAAQLEHDRGVYTRPPVQTVEYGEGNIKKSHYVTGAGGYNQRAIAAPDSADDMSQAQYMLAAAQMKPEQRLRLQKELVMNPNQNFLNTKSLATDYPQHSHNMINNLMSIAKAKKAGNL